MEMSIERDEVFFLITSSFELCFLTIVVRSLGLGLRCHGHTIRMSSPMTGGLAVGETSLVSDIYIWTWTWTYCTRANTRHN